LWIRSLSSVKTFSNHLAFILLPPICVCLATILSTFTQRLLVLTNSPPSSSLTELSSLGMKLKCCVFYDRVPSSVHSSDLDLSPLLIILWFHIKCIEGKNQYLLIVPPSAMLHRFYVTNSEPVFSHRAYQNFRFCLKSMNLDVSIQCSCKFHVKWVHCTSRKICSELP
jgi:hypothetical protein